MKQLVITILGKDRPGLVEDISSVVLKNHGNWLCSNLSHLLGHFAGIIQLEVAEEHFRNCKTRLPLYQNLKCVLKLAILKLNLHHVNKSI